MPVYFFHLRDGEDILLDADGRELDGAEAIADAALHEARAIIADEVLDGNILLDRVIDVENDDGRVVHRLSFADAVKLVPPNN